MHSVHINYFFLNHRRQWASFSDLLILFTLLGLCQRKPRDLSSFTDWGRNSRSRFPAQATKQSRGGRQILEGYAAQWGDHPPVWQPTYSWGVTLSPSHIPTARADREGGKACCGVRAGMQLRWEPRGVPWGVILLTSRAAPAGFPHCMTQCDAILQKTEKTE